MRQIQIRPRQKGQALLVVLLSMAVVLTIVLSVLSRSVTDIAITSRGEESIRAFSAAEAGVEQVLIGQSTSGTFEGATFTAKVDEIGRGLRSFAYPVEIAMGDTATVWFVAHDSNDDLICNGANPCFTGNSFTVCWGANKAYSDSSLMPAIEVSVYYLNIPGNRTTARVARGVYDPNTGRRATNNFDGTAAGCTVDGKTFPFSAVINLTAGGLGIPAAVVNTQNGLQLAMVRFLYNSDMAHPFGVTSAVGTFPNQGRNIESTGKSGDATRKVKVQKLYSDIPPIFTSSIFAPVGITK